MFESSPATQLLVDAPAVRGEVTRAIGGLLEARYGDLDGDELETVHSAAHLHGDRVLAAYRSGEPAPAAPAGNPLTEADLHNITAIVAAVMAGYVERCQRALTELGIVEHSALSELLA